MFRSSASPAATPQRQLLLQSQQPQKVSPTKKSLSSGLRSLLFHSSDEANNDHQPHSSHEYAGDEPPAPVTKVTAMPTKIKQVAPEVVVVAATPVSPPPQQTGEIKKRSHNLRDTFQRANSHPIRLDASAALSASRSFDPSMSRAAALDPSSFQTQPRSSTNATGDRQHHPQTQPLSLRSTVFGSSCHVLSAVVDVLFQTIKQHHECIDPHTIVETPAADTTVRKAKLLYIALLEKAQKVRGEWQGFAAEESNNHTTKQRTTTTEHGDQEDEEEQSPPEDQKSTSAVLVASLKDASKEDAFAVLHELLELSFRNLRVSLVAPAVFSKHRHDLVKQSLVAPVALPALQRIARFVNDLSRDEKSCLLRLTNLWYARCIVDSSNQELARIIEERHTLILSESSEIEFMQQVARKSARPDPLAIDLLMVMVQHRDLLFSDLELYTIRQEMQIAPQFPELVPPQEPEQLDASTPKDGGCGVLETLENDHSYDNDASIQVDEAATHSQDADTLVEDGDPVDTANTTANTVENAVDPEAAELAVEADVRVDLQPVTRNEQQNEIADQNDDDVAHAESATLQTKTEQLQDELPVAESSEGTPTVSLHHQLQEIQSSTRATSKRTTIKKLTNKKAHMKKNLGRASSLFKRPANLHPQSARTRSPLGAATSVQSPREKQPMSTVVVPPLAVTEATVQVAPRIQQLDDSQPQTAMPMENPPVRVAGALEPRDTLSTYVGLSITAAALGALVTIALQSLRQRH